MIRESAGMGMEEIFISSLVNKQERLAVTMVYKGIIKVSMSNQLSLYFYKNIKSSCLLFQNRFSGMSL